MAANEREKRTDDLLSQIAERANAEGIGGDEVEAEEAAPPAKPRRKAA